MTVHCRSNSDFAGTLILVTVAASWITLTAAQYGIPTESSKVPTPVTFFQYGVPEPTSPSPTPDTVFKYGVPDASQAPENASSTGVVDASQAPETEPQFEVPAAFQTSANDSSYGGYNSISVDGVPKYGAPASYNSLKSDGVPKYGVPASYSSVKSDGVPKYGVPASYNSVKSDGVPKYGVPASYNSLTNEVPKYGVPVSYSSSLSPDSVPKYGVPGLYNNPTSEKYGVPGYAPGVLSPAYKKDIGVKFLLYYNLNETESYHDILTGNKESLSASAYNASRPLKILIHAALANSQTPDDVKVIKDAYLINCIEANIIMADYGFLSKSKLPSLLAPFNFIQAFMSLLRTNQLAQEIADFIDFLLKEQVLPSAAEVHLIGFGLGAHIAGTVGRTIKFSLGSNVGRVTGLDPLIMGKLPLKPFRIDPTDALFVDVTNTALRKYTLRRRGHVRFYVNGGGPHQPNCPRFFTSSGACSHHTAIVAFAKSIDKPKSIVGCRCLSIFCRSQFLNSNTCVDPIVYGEYAEKTSRGNYYVTLT